MSNNNGLNDQELLQLLIQQEFTPRDRVNPAHSPEYDVISQQFSSVSDDDDDIIIPNPASEICNI